MEEIPLCKYLYLTGYLGIVAGCRVEPFHKGISKAFQDIYERFIVTNDIAGFQQYVKEYQALKHTKYRKKKKINIQKNEDAE